MKEFEEILRGLVINLELEQAFSDQAIDSDEKPQYKWSKIIKVFSPINGEKIAEVLQTTKEGYERVIQESQKAFEFWKNVPAPKRGEIVRQFGDELRKLKKPLGTLVTIEMGKSLEEGLGEVQEMIDMCDMAVGQSRMLYGVQTHSERPGHRMYEQWKPKGIVGIITAFNFPVAVWAWNITNALICGDTVLWKPSSSTPLTAIACQKILARVLERNGIPVAVSALVIGGGSTAGEWMINDKRIPLISFTGSVETGKHVAQVVAERLGHTILELGGNNAVIVTKNANLELAVQNAFFGAIGTAGQRCTSTRRVIVEDVICEEFANLLLKYYSKLEGRIGSPLDKNNLMGPLVNVKAADLLMQTAEEIVKQDGKILLYSKKLDGEKYPGGCYVSPGIAEVSGNIEIVQQERFVPMLYLIKYSGELKNAIDINNGVPQGLSSAIFTNDLREAEEFLGPNGSDCGIANINAGTSGAEIGLGFGGNKDTGGGREAGSDAWKQYMDRQNTVINFTDKTILAQGIEFD